MTYRELLKNSLDKCWSDEVKDAETGKILSRSHEYMPLSVTWFMKNIAAIMCYAAKGYLEQDVPSYSFDEGKTMTSGKAITQPTVEDLARVIIGSDLFRGSEFTHTFHKFFTWLFDQEFEYPDHDLHHMWNSIDVLGEKWNVFLDELVKEETK